MTHITREEMRTIMREHRQQGRNFFRLTFETRRFRSCGHVCLIDWQESGPFSQREAWQIITEAKADGWRLVRLEARR